MPTTEKTTTMSSSAAAIEDCSDEGRRSFSSSPPSFRKESVAGSPVACLSLPRPDLCLYGQGPFLHRVTLTTTATATGEEGGEEEGKTGGEPEDDDHPLLVFPYRPPSPSSRLPGCDVDNNDDQGDGGGSFSIRGIRYSDDGDNDGLSSTTTTTLAAAFGGRGLALVRNALRRNVPMRSVPTFDDYEDDLVITAEEAKEEDEEEKQVGSCWIVSDWIWDCRFLLGSTKGQDDEASSSASYRLAVGLAHNSVQIWELFVPVSKEDYGDANLLRPNPRRRRGRRKLVRHVRGNDHSITYCMDIFPSSSSGAVVAFGSVTQEVLVWSLEEEAACAGSATAATTISSVAATSVQRATGKQQSLRGHEGVIHSVRFDGTGGRLASTSDDRTVRLWRYYAEGADDGEWRPEWAAWGHAARCWDVAFCCERDTMLLILTTGEDGTARLWSEDGSPVAVFRGHASLSVWSVDTCSMVAVTGGDDGTVAVYDLRDYVTANNILPSPVVATSILVPDDSHRLLQEVSTDVTHQQKKNKKPKRNRNKVSQNAIVGIEFFSNTRDNMSERADGDETRNLLVATRSGSLFSFDLALYEWTEYEPWFVPSLTEDYGIDSSEGCCLSIDPLGTSVAIGTTLGNIVVIPLVKVPCSDNHTDETATACLRTVLDASECKTIQKLSWISDCELLSHHVRTLLLWTIPVPSAYKARYFLNPAHTLCRVMKPGTSGMPISSALNELRSLLATGDTRGSLALFSLGQGEVEKGGYLTPVSVLERVHGKEHVTGLWMTNTRVFSVGNNGCVGEYAILGGNRLQPLLSVSLSQFTGLDQIWCYAIPGGTFSTVVAGYYGNIFAVKDASTGYEFIRVDTGGRQRSHSCDIRSYKKRSSSALARLAVAINRADGRHEIQLTSRPVFGLRGGSSYDRPTSGVATYRAGIGLHSETIFDSCLFDIGVGEVALLTGSEDNSSRISLIRSRSLISSKLLPSQESGVRAVCTSRVPSNSTTLVVVGGSKLTLQLYLVKDFARHDDPANIFVSFIGYGKPPEKEKSLIDQRINTVTATPFISRAGDKQSIHLVAAGDSNGSCYLYRVKESREKRNVTGILLHRAARPILSLVFVTLANRVFLLAGTTGGDLMFFEVESSEDEVYSSVLLTLKPHHMGTNCISAVIAEIEGESVVRVCTGGDDQSIVCSDIVVRNLGGEARVQRSATARSASQSAIRGISWIDDTHLIATGYDQRLKLWELSFPSLRCVSCEIVEGVGDINCLAHNCSTNGRHILAVGGAGIALFSLR